MAKICIVPDVHGRTFWKAAKKFDGPIVFLGDYFDPYSYEKGFKQDADSLLQNFREIVDFRDTHDNVTLLKGNHDFHYLTGLAICTRFNAAAADRITDALSAARLKNATHIDGVLFTHAALSRHWAGMHEFTTADEAADFINDSTNDKMATIARARGGWDIVGSPIWQDADLTPLEDQYDFQQICGHTQLEETGSFQPWGNITCVDSRCCFILDTETRELTPYK